MSTLTANSYKALLFKKIIDIENDTIKIALMKKGFSFNRANHSVYADISSEELATAYGYTALGETLLGVTVTQDDVNNEAVATFNNMSWVANGGSLETDGAIIYDDTVAAPVADPLIGYIDFGGTILTIDGGTFTVANIAIVND